jgi:ABC-type multidrug transport system, ATPase component
MIQIDNLSKSYGSSVVLRHVNITFEEGKIHGLLGLNGAGKSTLLRLMAGVYEPDEGIIQFEGENLRNNTRLKEKLFFLSDDPYYNANASIRDLAELYASFYPNFSSVELTKNLSLLQIQSSGTLSSFSKGMRRKAYIALAFASGAEVLLLDEVFDGLDPTSRIEFKRLLSAFISDDPHRLVIVASHSLRELEDIADTFVLIKDGEIQNTLYEQGASPLQKVQLAFAEIPDVKLFSGLQILRSELDGRFLTLYVQGQDEKTIQQYLLQFAPLFIQIKPASLEETFVELTEAKQ